MCVDCVGGVHAMVAPQKAAAMPHRPTGESPDKFAHLIKVFWRFGFRDGDHLWFLGVASRRKTFPPRSIVSSLRGFVGTRGFACHGHSGHGV